MLLPERGIGTQKPSHLRSLRTVESRYRSSSRIRAAGSEANLQPCDSMADGNCAKFLCVVDPFLYLNNVWQFYGSP